MKSISIPQQSKELPKELPAPPPPPAPPAQRQRPGTALRRADGVVAVGYERMTVIIPSNLALEWRSKALHARASLSHIVEQALQRALNS